MRRREFLGAVLTLPAITVAPPPAGLSAIVALPGKQPITFSENAGADLGGYADPAGRFTMTCKRQIIVGCPIQVDFRRIPGTTWSSAIFYYGDINSQSNANLPGYVVTIGGQTIQVPAHWKFARWRWQSGPWPFPMVPVADLVARKLLPRFDAGVNHGTARPYAPLTYTPMGLAGIFPQMGGTGARPDIGPVTDWQAEYLCTGAPTALANTLAQGEAGGTIPWFTRDPATSALVDPTSAQWSRASFYGTSGSPRLIGAKTNDTVTVRFSGTPGCTIQPPANWVGGPITIADGLGQQWWCYGTLTVGVGGTVDALATLAGGTGKEPVGAWTIAADARVSAPPVTVAYVSGTRIAGSGIAVDSAHEPALAYLPFLLTSDPYFLETLQAQVTFAALSASGGWQNIWAPPGMGQTRAVAWTTRDFMQAAAITPAAVPSWLLPKTTMEAMFAKSVSGLNAIMATQEPLRQVFRAIAGSRGTQGSAAYPSGCYIQTWQEDFVQAILAWGAMTRPELVSVARWHLQGLIARLNPDGTNGWCGGMPDAYQTLFQDTTAGPQYTSWAQSWTANTRALGLTSCPPLANLFLTGAGYDYPNGLQAALSIAWQAGFIEAKPALDLLATTLEAGLIARPPRGGKDWKWSLARV